MTKTSFTDLEKELLRIATSQYDGAQREIISLMAQAERVIQIGSIALFGVFSVGLAQGINSLFLIMPFLLCFLILIVLSRFELVHGLGGYKRYLEDEMAILLEENRFFWEKVCDELVHHSLTDKIIRAMTVAFGVVSAYFAVTTAWEDLLPISKYIFSGYLFIIVVFYVLTFTAYLGYTKMFNRLYQRCLSERRNPPPEDPGRVTQ